MMHGVDMDDMDHICIWYARNQKSQPRLRDDHTPIVQLHKWHLCECNWVNLYLQTHNTNS